MSFIKDTFKIFRNKYIFSITAFIAFMLFIDHNDFFIQWSRKSDLKKIKETKIFYTKKIEETQQQLANLENNPAALEKYAREKYLLKRDNEDIFIFEKSKNVASSKNSP